MEADGLLARPEVQLTTWARACELTPTAPCPGPSEVWVTLEHVSVP